jgi:hypothetical protein
MKFIYYFTLGILHGTFIIFAFWGQSYAHVGTSCFDLPSLWLRERSESSNITVVGTLDLLIFSV